MNCPGCQHPLIVLEHALLEVDYCTACKGVWLDAGELELLLGSAQAAVDFLRGGQAAAFEMPRRCPICRTKMNKEATAGTESVTYDVCPHRHGLWFDAGELGTVLDRGAPAGMDAPVIGWLREVFSAPGTA